MTFPLLPRSFSTNACPKRLDGAQFGSLFVNFGPNLSTQFPNSFRKSQPHTASQAKTLQGKWSYIDPLLIRFSSESGQNIGIHTFRGPFLEKPVFHIKPSEVIFSVGMSENCFLDSENWFLEFGILKYWNSWFGRALAGTWEGSWRSPGTWGEPWGTWAREVYFLL